jgi:hypothetical protein
MMACDRPAAALLCSALLRQFPHFGEISWLGCGATSLWLLCPNAQPDGKTNGRRGLQKAGASCCARARFTARKMALKRLAQKIEKSDPKLLGGFEVR